MPNSDDLLKVLGLIAAILAALILILKYLEELIDSVERLGTKISKHSPGRFIRPLLRFIVALATLALPIWLIIGAWFYTVGVAYMEAGALEQLIVDTRTFATLVTLQTLCVALYALAWAIWLLPWVFHGTRPRLKFWRKQNGTESEQGAGG